jgi:putative ABC transport system permease protein
MHTIAQNVRFSLRQLSKSPGFSLTVILTLAVGIGATTAIFSLVEGVLLRPLPFAHADRLVLLGDHLGSSPNTTVTAREIETYSNATRAFSNLGGYVSTTFEMTGGAVPQEVYAGRFTAGVFPTLGVQPTLGRFFTSQEESAHQQLAVIGDSFWLSRYHRDPNVLGRPIVLDRKSYTIVGVMPRTFEFPMQTGRLNRAQIWVPMSLTAEELSDGNAGAWSYQMVGRLKDGVTVPEAAEDADRVAQQIMRDFPRGMSKIHIQGTVTSLLEYAVADVRTLLQILFLAVTVVLLIACANVAGLLLLRAIRRRRECVIRLALGAGSTVIVRESMCEGLLFSLAGGLLGLAFAATGIRIAIRLLPESMPRVDSISIDAGVIVFALLLALATGVLCSVAPTLVALRTNLTEGLNATARPGTAASSYGWLRSSLVVSEIAIALVLLTVSGALLRSFQKMLAVDPGFRPEHVLVATYQLPLRQYLTDASVNTFNHAVMDNLSSKPGITAVGITNSLPGSGLSSSATFTIEGGPSASWKLQFASFASTYGDYFRALDIQLLDGRTFTADDTSRSPLVAIVNQSMARHCWPGQPAIGKHIHVGNPQKGLPWATVVGVVADTKIGSRDQPSTDQWYFPMQQPAILEGYAASGNLTQAAGGYIVLRSEYAPEQMIQTLHSTVAGIDPLLALDQVQPMDDVISNVEAARRFNTSLMTAFAMGALLLALTGIYVVVAFSTSLRTQEIAVRMALGAQRRAIAQLVMLSGTKLALLGCGLGLLGSFATSRLISSFLFDVSGTDPLVYIGAVSTMMSIALFASALPAARAASTNPVDALRSF